MDNGTGYYLPAGTATWDTTNNTVSFHVRRDYLADQNITAPYNVYAVTGYHARSNDWVANDDLAPNARDLDLAAPPMGPETRDAPVATQVTTKTYEAGSGSFVPSDSTLGVGLISAVDSRDYVNVPVELPVLGAGDADLAGRRRPRPPRRRRVVPEGHPERRGQRHEGAGALGAPRPHGHRRPAGDPGPDGLHPVGRAHDRHRRSRPRRCA